MTLEFFEKYSNIKFHVNPYSGSRGDPRGQMDGQTDAQTDRHDVANSRFSQFCERVWKCVLYLADGVLACDTV